MIVPEDGRRIELYWPRDDRYYSGKVTRNRAGFFFIEYDDGESEDLNLAREQWRYEGGRVALLPPRKRNWNCMAESDLEESSKSTAETSKEIHLNSPEDSHSASELWNMLDEDESSSALISPPVRKSGTGSCRVLATSRNKAKNNHKANQPSLGTRPGVKKRRLSTSMVRHVHWLSWYNALSRNRVVHH